MVLRTFTTHQFYFWINWTYGVAAPLPLNLITLTTFSPALSQASRVPCDAAETHKQPAKSEHSSQASGLTKPEPAWMLEMQERSQRQRGRFGVVWALVGPAALGCGESGKSQSAARSAGAEANMARNVAPAVTWRASTEQFGSIFQNRYFISGDLSKIPFAEAERGTPKFRSHVGGLDLAGLSYGTYESDSRRLRPR
ncbi:hypothetical protein EDB86DRAFT_3243776 [Lactarius hatsudake]|nr:hypothetical protein EDB86DRAFT_3243776 [Lactarius hatsudake]